MIRIEDLHVRRKGRALLQEIHLDLPRATALGVVGANGSGKSTLLGVLAGLVDPSKGRAWLDELDLVRQRAEARRRLGWLPQQPPPWPRRTPREVLGLVAELGGVARPDVTPVVDGMLELVGLSEEDQRPADTLSPGGQRRLALATALVHEPPVLLLDAPFRDLDPRGREEVLSVLEALRDMGRTLVVASHDTRALESLCTAFAVMEQGRVVRSGPLLALAAQAGVVRELHLWVPDAERARMGLAGRPGVTRVIAEDPDLLRVVPGPGEAPVADWWRQLDQVGQAPRAAEWVEPRLDDVLWSLWG